MEKERLNEEEFETENLTPTFWFLCLLIISLVIIIIIQCIQLTEIIDLCNDVNNILQNTSLSSQTIKANNLLKKEYIMEIIKSISIIIAEFVGIILSIINMHKIRLDENNKIKTKPEVEDSKK